MQILANALRKNEFGYPIISRNIEKEDPDKRQHPVAFPCSEIEKYRKKYEDDFQLIIYVKMLNGFYIIPFEKISDWFIEDSILVVNKTGRKVWRIWFRKPHFMRCTKAGRVRDMGQYFHGPEQMKEWLRKHCPKLSALVEDTDRETNGDISVESYVEALQKLYLHDKIKRLVAELYFHGPKTTLELTAMIGKTHHGSVNMLLGRWLAMPLCKELHYDFKAHGKSYATQVFAEFGDKQGNTSFNLLDNFRQALTSLQEQGKISLEE